jgi:ADP-heptose:LPS heptosyltransferase
VSPRPRLLVLRPLGLGDFLTGVPAYRALAAAFPRHERILAAPALLAPLAALEGSFDRLVPTAPLAPLDEELHGVEVAVDLHGRGPESHRALLAAEPKRLIAFANPAVPQSAGMPEWREDEHEADRWCRLLGEHGIPADPAELALAPPPGAVPRHARGATLIHPGAASAARRWPAERFAAVARAELDAGRSVVVTGSAEELPLARSVAARAGAPAHAVLAGRTDLVGLAALVAAAGGVVCGDTGVAHLATAYGTPSVVLFGPTSPADWGPPPERARHRALWAGIHGDPHADAPHPGLLMIEVADVLAALRGLERDRIAA